MRLAGLILLSACGLRGPAATPAPAVASVARVVELELVAREGAEGPGARSLEGRLWIRSPGDSSFARPRNGCVQERAPERGMGGPPSFSLTVGADLALGWQPATGRYEGSLPATGLDPAWREIALTVDDNPLLSLQVDGAGAFGDRPTVTRVDRTDDGGMRVHWRGDHAPADVAIVVEDGGRRFSCHSGSDWVTLPAELADRPGVRLSLAATRTRHRVEVGGTRVITRAIHEVPLVVRAATAPADPTADASSPAAGHPSRVGLDRGLRRRLGQRPRKLGRG